MGAILLYQAGSSKGNIFPTFYKCIMRRLFGWCGMYVWDFFSQFHFFVDMSVSDYICLEDSSILRKVSSVYIDLNMFFAVVIIFSSNFCLNTQVTKKTQFRNVPADELWWKYFHCGMLLGLSAHQLLMLFSTVLLGIILVAVCAILRQSKGLHRSCARHVENMK